MKRLLFLSVFMLALTAAFSQTKPKQSPTEKPPTQKEMDEMMKAAQKQMDNMSPADKKMMEDMGVKVPDMKTVGKSVSGISDEQLAKAAEDENRVVPLKDIARIASIPKTPLNDASLLTYLKSVQQQVNKKLDPVIFPKGEEIYTEVKKKCPTAVATGNSAVGLWIIGQPEMALYVMGKTCIDDPTDADNLNNYAALLAMAGGEEMALPILSNLNKQFPQNTTIQSNIALSWFGLGDIAHAEKYADSVIRIYAYHPQANVIKSRIEESKGNTAEAIAAQIRSIKEGYSQEKEDRLKKLGYKLKSDDLDWDKPMPQDPMGLSRFTWPEYPPDVEKSKSLELAWAEYKESCNNEIADLKVKMARLEIEYQAQSKQRMQEIIQAGMQGQKVQLLPPLAPKAIIKLHPLVENDAANTTFIFDQDMQILQKAYKKVAEKEAIYKEQKEALDKKYEDQIGEGKANPFDAICKDEDGISNEFLEVNHTLEVAFKGYQQSIYRRTGNLLYYCQYTQWPDEFELTKVHAQIAWLQMLAGQKVVFRNKSPWCYEAKPKKSKMDSLQQFDDVHCMYHSELNLILASFNDDCNILTSKIDLEVVKGGWKQDFSKGSTFLDQFLSGSIEVGLKKGVGYGKGPIRAEAKLGGALFMEVGPHGITDYGGKITADLKVGTNIMKPLDGSESIKGRDNSFGPIKDQSISIIGAEAKISLTGGFTTAGHGILRGVK